MQNQGSFCKIKLFFQISIINYVLANPVAAATNAQNVVASPYQDYLSSDIYWPVASSGKS
jgi:hypothetical protein